MSFLRKKSKNNYNCLFARVRLCGVEDGGGVDDQGQPLWGGHGAHTPQAGKKTSCNSNQALKTEMEFLNLMFN
jgi:hypothetical protein